MLKKVGRWALVPLALATASITLLAPSSGAVTGPNIAEDFEHEYVGLVAFYDGEGTFLHRCTGTLLSPEVFLTAGHCVAAADDGAVAASARIWFEQDAGADYDPVTGEPASSGYPVSGGVTSEQLFNYGFTDLSTIPETHDVGLIVLEPGAVEAVYPDIGTYGTLAPVGYADTLGTGIGAVVTVSGYGVTRTNGKNGNNTLSYRERLDGPDVHHQHPQQEHRRLQPPARVELRRRPGRHLLRGLRWTDLRRRLHHRGRGQLLGAELELWRTGLPLPRRHRRGAGLDGGRARPAGSRTPSPPGPDDPGLVPGARSRSGARKVSAGSDRPRGRRRSGRRGPRGVPGPGPSHVDAGRPVGGRPVSVVLGRRS